MENSIEPIRVAVIMGKMLGGGVEAVVMNYYRNIDRKRIQFDFFIDRDSTIIPEEEIRMLGGKIYHITPYQNLWKYNKELNEIFKKNNYYIIHSHINSLSLFPLRIAKKNNIPLRIAHNHSTSAPGETTKNLIKNLIKKFSTKYGTHYMSPTKSTGEWLFGNDVEIEILTNAIEIKKFTYNEDIRKEMRKKLGYSSVDFVIGNIGRFVWQKNQLFLLQVFANYSNINRNAKLLIIGDGPLKKNIYDLARKLDILDLIKVIPNNFEINKYYNSMDLLVFPSHYEGLGMVAVEAQISGLPVLLSERVPKEVIISSEVHYLRLDNSIEDWVNLINKIYIDLDRSLRNKKVIDTNNYDIHQKAKELTEYYQMLLDSILRI